MKIIKPLYTHSFLDYPDPAESCLTINTVGCEHKCFNCSNPSLQDWNGIHDSNKIFIYNENNMHFLIDQFKIALKRYHTNNIAIAGGDPLHPNNIQAIKQFLFFLKTLKINSILYTGYDIDYCKDNGIENFTFLKTGRYIDSKKILSEKTDEYFQLASTNQKLYDSEYNLLSDKGRYYYGSL